MRAYSTDLRLKLLAAIDRGDSYARVARAFGVAPSTVGRYVRQRRERGHVRPQRRAGPPPAKRAALHAWLPGYLPGHADATLDELRAAFARERGVAASTATVSRALASLPPAAGGAWTLKQRRS